MGSELAAVDTNVLVYSKYSNSPQHAASLALLTGAQSADAGLCLFPQMPAEFYATVTNPKRVSPVLTLDEALQALREFSRLPGLILFPIPADVPARWMALLAVVPVHGRRVFDLQIAAAMLCSGVSTLYTYNTKDFLGIPGITAIEPPAV